MDKMLKRFVRLWLPIHTILPCPFYLPKLYKENNTQEVAVMIMSNNDRTGVMISLRFPQVFSYIKNMDAHIIKEETEIRFF